MYIFMQELAQFKIYICVTSSLLLVQKWTDIPEQMKLKKKEPYFEGIVQSV